MKNLEDLEKFINSELTSKINKNIIIETKPNKPIFPNDMAQGNRNAISKSNIIKSIATR